MFNKKIKADNQSANNSKEIARNDYCLKTPAEIISIFKTSENGLSNVVVSQRLAEYGRNELNVVSKTPAWKKFISRFTSPLIIILLVTGSCSLFFGDKRSAIIIYLMIFLSITLDFIQEHKSEKVAEKLKEKVVTKVEVFRDGQKLLIKASELVPGDVICLSVGSIVPADARVISADDLFVNESSLTGEAYPVAKSSAPLLEYEEELSKQSNMVFMGTNVVSGYGRAVVTATGGSSIFGKIAQSLVQPSETTEFERGVRGFGYLITKIILLLVAVIFVLNTFIAGHGFYDSLMFSLALAVGLTPELLPMIMSITLARGSLNMSKKGVIVKRLNSIHDFGGMDVLCTDKTGTLTENRIEMVKHVDINGVESSKLLDLAYINSFFQSGIENPLDEAVLRVKGVDSQLQYEKVDEIPFDFERRRLSIIVSKDGQGLLVSKGAPEEFLKICHSYEDNGKIVDFNADLQKIAIEQYQKLSRDGFRVLALGYKDIKIKKEDYSVTEEQDLVLSGFVAFLDPAKKNARHAIDLLEAQGIEIKIITGDNDLVTKKICQDVDVVIKGILTGEEIAKLTDTELQKLVETTTIFARVSPDQKGRIVRMIKANGHCVGYMGDGINDALPLKAADVGISVDNGVDVAKEAADLILLNKDLEVLSVGVDEGRKTFANTLKYILMGLSSNFGNMFSVAVASFLLPFLPMLPLQILLNNFLYDFSQTTIPLDNVDKEMIRKPKRWDLKFIKKFMFLFGPISSLFDITTFVVMYFVFRASAPLFQTGWFLESFATQTLVIFIIRTQKIPFVQSRPGQVAVG